MCPVTQSLKGGTGSNVVFQYWELNFGEKGSASPLPLNYLGKRTSKSYRGSFVLVLRDNVGPKIFINLSYICHITVRKLSVAKMCQKSDIKLSEN